MTEAQFFAEQAMAASLEAGPPPPMDGIHGVLAHFRGHLRYRARADMAGMTPRYATLFAAIVIAAWCGLALAAMAAELAVTVCSPSSGECEDRRVPLVAEATPLACMLQAPAILADPRAFDLRGDWRVARWRCA